MEEPKRYLALFYADTKLIAERHSSCVNSLLAKATVYIEDSFPSAYCLIKDMSSGSVVHTVRRSPIE